MAKRIVNIETGLDKVGVVNVEPASGNTVNTCEWFSLDADGNAVEGADSHNLVFLCIAGMERPDVYDSDPAISTGSITGVYGKFIATVDSNGYDATGTFALDTPLKVDSKVLTDGTAGTDIIVARALGALSDAVLRIACDIPVIVPGT